MHGARTPTAAATGTSYHPSLAYFLAPDPLAHRSRPERRQRGARRGEVGGLAAIDLYWRDTDVPLSDLGVDQSIAVGHRFAQKPEDSQPDVIRCSPYVRARETARLLSGAAALEPGVVLRVEERLRGKDFGILDRLTRLGILTREYGDRRVQVVAHQVIVNCMRYLIEQMDEHRCSASTARATCQLSGDLLSFSPGRRRRIGLSTGSGQLRRGPARSRHPVTTAPDRSTASKP